MSTTTTTTSKYSLLDDVLTNTNVDYESNLTRLELAVEFLLTQFKEAHEIVNDRRALKAALYLNKLTQIDALNRCLLDIDYMPLVGLLVDILVYCAVHAKQFVRENKFLHDVITADTTTSGSGSKTFTQYKSLKIKYHFVAYLIDVVCFYTEVAHTFRAGFHEAKGTMALMDYVSDERFVADCLRFNYSPTDHAQVGLNLLESFVRGIFNLSKYADAVKNDWDEMNATVKLMKFSASINR